MAGLFYLDGELFSAEVLLAIVLYDSLGNISRQINRNSNNSLVLFSQLQDFENPQYTFLPGLCLKVPMMGRRKTRLALKNKRTVKLSFRSCTDEAQRTLILHQY